MHIITVPKSSINHMPTYIVARAITEDIKGEARSSSLRSNAVIQDGYHKAE